jgi:hypothetical protein
MYRLENPDDGPVTLRLSLRADRHGRAVFEKTVTLGPRSELNGRELVVAAASDSYTLSLFRGTDRIERTSIPTRHTDPVEHNQIVFLNDDPEFSGSGTLSKTNLLNDRVRVSSVGARQAPHHWAGYSDARAVAICRPEFSDMTAMQFAALDEYVHRGGTLLFLEPDGTLGAAGTPLCDLLPVRPLRTRRVEVLPEVDGWGEQFRSHQDAAGLAARLPLASADGILFLESIPVGDGVTTLGHGDFPVIRWSRRGLGRVGVLAVSPLSPLMETSFCMFPLWNHILAWSRAPYAFRYYENSWVLPKVLAQLTGFKIPSVGSVSRVLVIYLVLLGVVLIAGFALRRHAAAWILAALLGVVFTVGIFATAFRQNADRPPSSATIVDFVAVSGEREIGQAAVSLFAKSDLNPTLIDESPGGRLRPLPSAARGKRKEPLTAPVIIRTEGDRVSAPSLRVQALKPRSFGSVYRRPSEAVPAGARLVFADGALTFNDAVLPEWVAGGSPRVLLVSEAGCRPVLLDGRVCKGLASGAGRVRFDTVASELVSLLSSGRFPSPSLAVLTHWDPGRHSLTLGLPGFEQQGYATFFLPLQVEVRPGRIAVPSESIGLKGAGTYGRMFFAEDGWRRQIARKATQIVPLDGVLPPYLSDMALDTLTVRMDPSNPGGNLEFAVGLGSPQEDISALDLSQTGEALWSRAVKPVSVQGTRHQFSGLAASNLLEPVSGRIRLLLRVSQKRLLTSPTEAERANGWTMVDFSVEAGGVFPSESEPRRF